MGGQFGDMVPGSNDGESLAPSLLIKLQGQDTLAWDKFVSYFGPVVYSWCRRQGLQEEDAADVQQEVFRAIARTIKTFKKNKPGDTFRGWLWTIVHNKVRDHWRKKQGEPPGKGGSSIQQKLQQVPGDFSLHSVSFNTSENQLFRRALELVRSEFEDRTWQAFWQVVVEGHSPSEVAQELGLSPGAVYVAKSRILKRLREELRDFVE